ncbi:hypothetical protein ACJROX_10825 [Pseudalkalibacillus sp. A8]|uniref:hypothetical protein n=1 Tax=Pseudalkalibacillus sp. A8 TaxID=3382641 RepID=UPI0038B5419C
MLQINRMGNTLQAEVLDKNFIVRAFNIGLEVTVMEGNRAINTETVHTTREQLKEIAHSVLLEKILNIVFEDISEQTDELLEALEDELSEHLSELALEGSGAQRWIQ